MDERRLTELLADADERAAASMPPSSFGHADVLAKSRRVGERRRRRLSAVASFVVLGLAAAGVAGAAVLGSPTAARPGALAAPPAVAEGTDPAAGAAPGAAPRAAAPYAAQEQAPGQAPAGPQARSAPAPTATPFGADKRAAASGCAQADPRLFAQLAEVLPELRGAAPRPLSDQVGCPAGGRGLEVDVDDDGARGVLRVLFSPDGGGMVVTGGGGGSVVTTSTSTPGGGSLAVSVVSVPHGDTPYAGRVGEIAHALAERQ
ncbi:MAG TPA: hypothetical protein VGH99_00285 [Pseudonocardia sp.]